MIRDRKDLDAFVTRMAQGRSAAKAKRAVSTAPPSAPPKPRGPKTLNAAKPPATKLPAPAKKSGVTVPSKEIGPGPGGGKSITINIS